MEQLYRSEDGKLVVNELDDGRIQFRHKHYGSVIVSDEKGFGPGNWISPKALSAAGDRLQKRKVEKVAKQKAQDMAEARQKAEAKSEPSKPISAKVVADLGKVAG